MSVPPPPGEGTTMRTLIEEGLRAALARREQKTSYQWPDLSVSGEGLAPEIEEGSWEPLRDRIYEHYFLSWATPYNASLAYAAAYVLLWLVLLVCASPIIASYFTFYVLKPEKRNNYGTLIDQRAHPVPAMVATTLDGKPVALEQFKGKWVMLTFGASWCKPCAKELPAWDKIAPDYKGKVEFVAVDLDSKIEDGKHFPLGNTAAFLDVELDDHPVDLGADQNLVSRDDVALGV